MIDPLQRWAEFGEKPDYAGPLSYGGAPYTQDPADLEGADVAIVGAPMDELVSDRPGTRFAPRAIRAASCPPGPQPRDQGGRARRAAGRGLRRRAHPARGSRPLPRRDTGDGRAGARRGRASRWSSAGTTRSPSLNVRACAAAHGPVGLVHFDTHTDTGAEVFGVELSHGTIMRRLVEEGSVDPRALRPDRAARLLARGGGVRLAEGARHHEPLHARRQGSGDQGGHGPGHRGGRRGPGLPHRGHRRARPGLRAGHGDAGARRDDHGRAAVGGAGGGRAAGRGRGRHGRGDPDRRGLGGHHRARGGQDRARDPRRHRPAPEKRPTDKQHKEER